MLVGTKLMNDKASIAHFVVKYATTLHHTVAYEEGSLMEYLRPRQIINNETQLLPRHLYKL